MSNNTRLNQNVKYQVIYYVRVRQMTPILGYTSCFHFALDLQQSHRLPLLSVFHRLHARYDCQRHCLRRHNDARAPLQPAKCPERLYIKCLRLRRAIGCDLRDVSGRASAQAALAWDRRHWIRV